VFLCQGQGIPSFSVGCARLPAEHTVDRHCHISGQKKSATFRQKTCGFVLFVRLFPWIQGLKFQCSVLLLKNGSDLFLIYDHTVFYLDAQVSAVCSRKMVILKS
jgi:hypothetical protein